MPTFCAVLNCGTVGGIGLPMYRFPSRFDNRGRLCELSSRRLDKWIAALKRKDLTEAKIKYERVCGRHFVTGKKADLLDVNDPDWIPSINMGYGPSVSLPMSGRILNRKLQESENTVVEKQTMICTEKHSTVSNMFKTVLLKDSSSTLSQETRPVGGCWGLLFDDPCAPFSCSTSVPEPYTCVYCDFRTFFKVVYRDHVEIVHQLKKLDSEQTIRNYTCRGCKYATFSQFMFFKHQLEEHILIRTTKWSECEQCPQGQGSKIQLLGKSVGGGKCYQCEHCSYIAYKWQDLRRHIYLKHTPEEEVVWFRCELCAYKTRWRCYLKRHVLCKHDSSKRGFLQCNQCSYKTMRQDRLEKHLNAKHMPCEEAVWFQCGLCLTYKTKRRDTLRRHIKTVHESSSSGWLKCTECSYKTRREDYLRIHLRSKHDSFFCTIQM